MWYLKDENEDLTSGQEQRLRRMEREYERRQQVVFSLIQGGWKTVHVVFKYLSRSLLSKGVGASGYSAPLTTTRLPRWSVDISSFKDDVTVILLRGVSLMCRPRFFRSPGIESKDAMWADTKIFSYSVPSPHRLFKNSSSERSPHGGTRGQKESRLYSLCCGVGLLLVCVCVCGHGEEGVAAPPLPTPSPNPS